MTERSRPTFDAYIHLLSASYTRPPPISSPQAAAASSAGGAAGGNENKHKKKLTHKKQKCKEAQRRNAEAWAASEAAAAGAATAKLRDQANEAGDVEAVVAATAQLHIEVPEREPEPELESESEECAICLNDLPLRGGGHCGGGGGSECSSGRVGVGGEHTTITPNTTAAARHIESRTKTKAGYQSQSQ